MLTKNLLSFLLLAGASAPPYNVVCISITSSDELLSPAAAVVSDVPHPLYWQ